jgi:type IV fimbrial biogenesis protein FimT
MRTRTVARQRGLSLTESLVALALVAGVLRLGVPAMTDVMQTVRLVAAADEMLADLHLARMEAQKRNRRVALCKSLDGQHCTAAGGWDQGWIVFHDENNNGLLDPGEELIARHDALPASLSLVGNTPVARYISYSALGASRLTGGGFQAGTLTVCRRSVEPTASRQIILNSVGRPRVQKATVATCA